MTYKFGVEKGGKGPKGLAQVLTKGNKVKVILKEGGEYILNRADCPKICPPGVWQVSLSAKGEKLYNLWPNQGLFKVKTAEFAHQENKPPTPRTKFGQDYNYQFFVVDLEVVSGDELGMIIPLFLRYHFGLGQEEVNGKLRDVVKIIKPGSKYTPILMDYLDAAGAQLAGPMPYQDNVLPALEKRILRADRTFEVVVKNGFVDSILTSEGFAQGFEPDVEK